MSARYWWSYGPTGWTVDTHNDNPHGHDVITVEHAGCYEEAVTRVRELNRSNPSTGREKP